MNLDIAAETEVTYGLIDSHSSKFSDYHHKISLVPLTETSTKPLVWPSSVRTPTSHFAASIYIKSFSTWKRWQFIFPEVGKYSEYGFPFLTCRASASPIVHRGFVPTTRDLHNIASNQEAPLRGKVSAVGKYLRIHWSCYIGTIQIIRQYKMRITEIDLRDDP